MNNIKRTAQNSKLPPLKYELLDSYTNGDNKYELRELNSGIVIYLYSNRTKDWTVYQKFEAVKTWEKLTG
jgi:hypothetical protein